MKPKLLIAESGEFSEPALRRLETTFAVTCLNLDRATLLKEIREYDAVWVRLRTMIDEEILEAAPKLRVLATNTTGLNHIDVEAATLRGIKVVSLRGEVDFLNNIRATAELTLALTLAVIRHIPSAHQHVMDGGWDRTLFRGTEIYEQTIGVVGYGRLGKIVATLFRAFGAKVLVTDPKLPNGSRIDNCEVLPLCELLANSQIVSLHVNSLRENQGFFGKNEFDCMKSGAIFINTSRGELVDEDAMLHAVSSRLLGGVGLDVISTEHVRTVTMEQLCNLSNAGFNIVITPHIGGNTTESTERTEQFIAARLVHLFSNHCHQSGTP